MWPLMNVGILKNVFSEFPEPLKMILIYSSTYLVGGSYLKLKSKFKALKKP